MTDLPEGAVGWFNDLARWTGTWLHTPAFRVRVSGAERIPKTGPVVLVANHSTQLEPQLIFGHLGRRSVYLAKEELFRGIQGRSFRAVGHIPVRRGEPQRAPLLTAVGILKGGGVVSIFPEGTRGDGDVTNAENGAAWLVRSTGAVVLPVASRGALRPPGSRRRFRPRVDILYGEPFELAVAKGRTGLVDATETIRVRLAALVTELDERRAARHTTKASKAES